MPMKTIRCNQCMQELDEWDLVPALDAEDGEPISEACPNCLTDHYLMDMETSKA